MYIGGGSIARDVRQGRNRVQLDGRLSLLTLVAALLFLWPLLAYGRPGYIQDSAAYYKGGRMAVTFVLDRIRPLSALPTNARSAANSQASPIDKAEVRGARSVAYSLAAYIFGAPKAQMWVLCAFQALVTGFLAAVTLLAFAGNDRGLWRRLAVLALASPVAFVVCLAIPDIFAGVVILAIALIATAFDRMSTGVRTVTTMIAAAGVAFHASHLPIALAMTLSALAWFAFAAWRGQPVPRSQWTWTVAPFVLGAAVIVACNFAAFGGPSLTGKRYPLTLARSVAEGPGRWYLEKNCRHLKYAICEVYPDAPPGEINAFLWGPNGLKHRASPEQMDRIRAEESEVVLAATRAYPLEELRRVGSSFARQLVRFEPGVAVLDSSIVLDPEGTPQLRPANYDRFWTTIVHWLTIVSVSVSILVLFLRFRADGSTRPMIGLVLTGILVNAGVCVYFSGIVDRYGARTIWVLPLLALALGGRSRAGGDRDASRARRMHM